MVHPELGKLHSHPAREEMLGIPEDHVIVNRSEWIEARTIMNMYPDLMTKDAIRDRVNEWVKFSMGMGLLGGDEKKLRHLGVYGMPYQDCTHEICCSCGGSGTTLIKEGG